MTNQDINEQVARKLGWELCPGPCNASQPRHVRSTLTHAFKDYSTSIEAAWEILDSLVSRKRFVSIEFDTDNNEWDCMLGADKKDYEPDARAQASTAPLAICKAFLKLP